MRNRIAGLLLVIGIAFVIIGFTIRNTEVHVVGATGRLACGSAASPNLDQATHDGNVHELVLTQQNIVPTQNFSTLNEAACEDALSTPSTWAWILFSLAAVTVLAAGLTYAGPDGTSRPAEDAAAETQPGRLTWTSD